MSRELRDEHGALVMYTGGMSLHTEYRVLVLSTTGSTVHNRSSTCSPSTKYKAAIGGRGGEEKNPLNPYSLFSYTIHGRFSLLLKIHYSRHVINL